MLILLCGNNVQACAFHVECNATRDSHSGKAANVIFSQDDLAKLVDALATADSVRVKGFDDGIDIMDDAMQQHFFLHKPTSVHWWCLKKTTKKKKPKKNKKNPM